jgi:iron complex outermembrane receptor protein
VTQGDLLTLPAGTVHAVIGGEWRNEEMHYDSVQSSVNQGIDHGRDVGAGFVEIEIPIAGEISKPRTQGLALNLAARYDHYSDFGESINPQFGIRWRPLESLLLRASYGTSFRPPSLFELYTPVVMPTNVPVRDPARGNELVQVTFISGGNPALEALDGDSFTAGFVLSPSAIPGLKALATYWKVHQDNRVTVIPFGLILGNEAVFSDRVTRAEPTAQDIAAGRPGRLMQVDITRVNFGSLDTSGVDLQLGYDVETRLGKFSPIVAATWVGKYDSVDLPSTPVVTRIGVANTLGAIPRWKVSGTLAWERGPLGLAASANWIPAYRDANLLGPINRQIGSQTLVDVSATLRLEEWLGEASFWSGIRVEAGCRNVFDKEPEFAEIGFNYGFDPSQSDLTQRFGFVRVSKSF